MEMYRKIRQMIHNNYLDLTKLWNRKDNYKNSFDAVLEELNGFVMNHEENDNLLPSEIHENTSGQSDKSSWSTQTKEISDDENYLDDGTVWDRMENASCTSFDESNHKNHGMNIIYRFPHLDLEMGDNDNYYDEGGCPFDSYNLANWDGDQQVGFRE